MRKDLFEFLGMSCGRRQPDAAIELGLVIWSVELGSAAERAGLQAGDVLLEVNHRAITMSEEALEGARAARKGNVLLRVWTRGKARYFLVNAEATGARDGAGA